MSIAMPLAVLNIASFLHRALRGTLSLLLAAGGAAQATVVCCNAIDSSPESGRTVELVFVAWDGNGASPKVQYTLDLGIAMGDFFVNGQQDAGSRLTLWLGGSSQPGFAQFLATDLGGGVTVDPARVRWAVLAFDTNGSLAPGEISLYTTLQQGVSGDPKVILGLSDWIGDKLDNARTPYLQFMSDVNQTGTHKTAADGWSIVNSTATDKSFAFKPGGIGDTAGNFNFNGILNRSIGNQMGQSSWFYGVASSDEFDSTLPVAIDEFDNLAHDAYWGLAASTDPAHPGEYLLSYTLEAVTSPLEQAQGVVFGNSFARLAGTFSLSSPAGQAASTLTLTQGFLRGIALQTKAAAADASALRSAAAVSAAVPEPGAAALWLAGLGLGAMAAAVRRRRA